MIRPFIHTCTIQLRGPVGVDDYGEPVYVWDDDQIDIECRFIYPKGNATIEIQGEAISIDLMALLPHTVTLAEHEYRITTTQSGYIGTYEILKVRPIPWRDGIHHYELDLRAMETFDIPTGIDGGGPTTTYHVYVDGGSP